MQRPIVHAEFMLSRPSEPATPADLGVAVDLMDTLRANRASCVGMAANMIGSLKRIIVFVDGDDLRCMLNPRITEKSGEYQTQEGCLSLSGVRDTRRFQHITVTYDDQAFQPHTESFEGFTAQIIQHEVDHCDGILI
jgi:peptide deformylase